MVEIMRTYRRWFVFCTISATFYACAGWLDWKVALLSFVGAVANVTSVDEFKRIKKTEREV